MRHTNKDCDDTIRQMASICFSKQALLWDKLQENSRSQLIQNGHTKELEKRKKTTVLFQQNNIKGCMFDPKSIHGDDANSKDEPPDGKKRICT